MRLRYLNIDYFDEASKKAHEEYIGCLLPVPKVPGGAVDRFEIQPEEIFLSVELSLKELIFEGLSKTYCSRGATACKQFLSTVIPAKLFHSSLGSDIKHRIENTDLAQSRLLESWSNLRTCRNFEEIEPFELEFRQYAVEVSYEQWQEFVPEHPLPLPTVNEFSRKVSLDIFPTPPSLENPPPMNSANGTATALKSSSTGIDLEEAYGTRQAGSVASFSAFIPIEVRELRENLEECLSNLIGEPLSFTFEGLPGQLQLGSLPTVKFDDTPNYDEPENILSRIVTPKFSIEEKLHLTSNFAPTNFINARHSYDDSLDQKEKLLCSDTVQLELPVLLQDYLYPLSAWDPETLVTVSNAVPIDIQNLEAIPQICFQSLVVMPELRLNDNLFNSIPVPVVSDHAAPRLEVSIIEERCQTSKHLSTVATDWLYLDWHFLQEMECNMKACFTLQAKMKEPEQMTQAGPTSVSNDILKHICVDSCPLSKSHNSLRESKVEVISLSDSPQSEILEGGPEQFLHSGDSHSPPRKKYSNILVAVNNDKGCRDFNDAERHRDSHSPPQNNYSNILVAVNNDKECRDLNDAERQTACESRIQAHSTDLDLLPNDLTYFLQARKGIHSTSVIKKSEDNNMASQISSPSKLVPLQPVMSTGFERDIATTAPLFVHNIDLSDRILELMESLGKDYNAILQATDIIGGEIEETLDFPHEFSIEIVGNQALISLLNRITSQPTTKQTQIWSRRLFGLQALRHSAWNLCTYGIQVAHLYLEHLIEVMPFLEAWTLTSQTELEEAYNQVERCSLEDHPKLTTLDQVVTMEKSRHHNLKILLLADRRAYFTLFNKLVSLSLKPFQIDRTEDFLQNGNLREDKIPEIQQTVLEGLAFSECLLVPYVYITKAFPLEKFTTIIEYGEPQDADHLDCILHKGCFTRHCFKVSWTKDNSSSKAYVSTKETPSHIPQGFPVSRMWAQTSAGHAQQHLTSAKQLPEYTPQDQYLSPPTAPLKTTNENVTSLPEKQRTTLVTQETCILQNQTLGKESCSSSSTCEITIVANISEPIEHKLTGRMRSYQKIVSLEKRNLQVVERELQLPIDLSFSAAACLILYSKEKLELGSLNSGNEGVYLVQTVQVHLKAISYSYRDVILIFECQQQFIMVIEDSLDIIYASAVELGIRIQCFLSERVETTDIIIMKCVEAVRLARTENLYPVMTETPTIAEVFLTAFPSINPHTAHAILSSGLDLPAFIAMSLEEQVRATGYFDIPLVTLNLFKVECGSRLVGVLPIPRIGAETDMHQKDMQDIHSFHSAKSAVDIDELVPLKSSVRSNGFHGSKNEHWCILPDFPPQIHFTDKGDWCETPNFPSASEMFIESGPELDSSKDRGTYWTEKYSERKSTLERSLTLDEEEGTLWPLEFSSSQIGLKDFAGPSDPSYTFESADVSTSPLKGTLKATLDSWFAKRKRGSSPILNRGNNFKVAESTAFSADDILTPFQEWYKDLQSPTLATHSKLEKERINVLGRGKPKKAKPPSFDCFRYKQKPANAISFRNLSPNSRDVYEPIAVMSRQDSMAPFLNSCITPADKRSQKTLGLTRSGNDRQQRLTWRNSSRSLLSTSKRPRLASTYKT